MGEESGENPSGQDETQAHHVSISPQEDRSRTAGTMGKGPCEESGLGPVDSGRTNDSSHLQTEEKVYATCDRGGKARPRPGRLSYRCGDHASYWETGSGYRVCRQPGKNFGFIHQACGA